MSFNMSSDQRAAWEKIKAKTSWTDEGLKTARNDLIEHGWLYVNGESASHVAVLDYYLWDSGIRFSRNRFSKSQRYELVDLVPLHSTEKISDA